jgi:hypothetical protein
MEFHIDDRSQVGYEIPLKNLRGLSPRAICTDRATAAKLLLTFEDRGCHVVRVTDPYGRILGFLDRMEFLLLYFILRLNTQTISNQNISNCFSEIINCFT